METGYYLKLEALNCGEIQQKLLVTRESGHCPCTFCFIPTVIASIPQCLRSRWSVQLRFCSTNYGCRWLAATGLRQPIARYVPTSWAFNLTLFWRCCELPVSCRGGGRNHGLTSCMSTYELSTRSCLDHRWTSAVPSTTSPTTHVPFINPRSCHHRQRRAHETLSQNSTCCTAHSPLYFWLLRAAAAVPD